MPRELWCRHADCGKTYESTAGHIPIICPHCERTALWTTEQPEPPPVKPYVLSENDRRFLKSLRIASNNDHEQDGA